MSETSFRDIIQWTIDALDSMKSEDSWIEALGILIPESIIVAAFDILDRRRVLKLTTPGGRFLYHVEGSSKTYPVLTDLPSPKPDYCSCYAFMYNVLINKNQTMCKHILAVLLARKLGKFTERAATLDEIAFMMFKANEDNS